MLHGEYNINNNLNLPLVSIITIVYNNADHIRETIESVLGQTYPNIEYIVIDGGSTDGTIDILKEFNDRITYWISEKDEGISDAFNKGLKVAKGCLIGLINSDDYYEKNVISKIISHPGIVEIIDTPTVIYGKTHRVLKSGKKIFKKSNQKSWAISAPFSHCSSFVTKSYYEKYGLFSKKYKIAMDVDLLMRGLNEAKYIYVPFYIANQRVGGISEKHRLYGYKEYFLIAKDKKGLIKAIIGYIYKFLIYFLNKSTKL